MRKVEDAPLSEEERGDFEVHQTRMEQKPTKIKLTEKF